jgi:Anp1
MSKPRVAMCIPSGDTWKAQMALQTMALGAYSASHVFLMPINVRTQDTAESRNQMTAAALAEGAEWLLWIDADMVFPPDALVRLLAHNVDIVGADYRRRAPPYPRIGKPITTLEAWRDIHKTPLVVPSRLTEVTMLGLGLMLVKAEVLQRMGQPSFIRAWLLDQATPTNPTGFSTEDGYLCGHARHLGYKVWCDLDLSNDVGHICEAPVSWNQGRQAEIGGVACMQSSA